MGVQVAGNLPLNHFITDLRHASKTPAEVLERKIASLKCKAFLLSALEKISYVALVAIMGTILAISYTAMALTGNLPLLIAGMALSTPLIAWGLTKFTILSNQFSRKAQLESLVLLQMKEIEYWKAPQINQFLVEQRLAPNLIPLDALRQLDPDEPLRPLIPLIARFKLLAARSQEIEDEVNISRAKLEEGFRQKEAEEGKPIDPQVKQKIRYEAQNTASKQHEREAVPMALNAAVLLQIIQDPTQNLDVEPFSLDIPGVGTSVPKTFGERVFGRHDEVVNDDYFTFHPDLHREPLALRPIEQNLQPRELRFMLFPNAIRA
jgi:hypothetical protein